MTRQVPPSDGWFRNPYRAVDLSTSGTHIYEKVPAALIRVRTQGTPSRAGEGSKIKTHAVLDTGASRTAVPLWMLLQLGIAVGERLPSQVLSATGWTRVYRTEIEMEVPPGTLGLIWDL